MSTELFNLAKLLSKETIGKEITKGIDTKETSFNKLKEHIVKNSVETIKDNTLETIQNKIEIFQKEFSLSPIEKEMIAEETGWSKEIINNIRSIKEYNIYKNINLEETKINGRETLIRKDINWKEKDSLGRTNLERIESGLSPIKDGEKIELHHIGQKEDSPLVELKTSEHRGIENNKILHNTLKESEINRDGFNKLREEYWKERAKIIKTEV